MAKISILSGEYTEEQLLSFIANEQKQNDSLPVASLQLFITAMREVNLPSTTVKEILSFLLEND